jgi:alpha-glucosidase
LFVFTALIVIKSFASEKLQIFSPDKTIRIEITADNKLLYSVFVDNKKILDSSLINMQLPDDISLSNNLKIKSTKTRSINEMIVAQVPVSRKNIPDVYNELIINFKNNFSVIFRAYNDGVAYRIATSFKDSVKIENETAQFNFTNVAHAYAPIIEKRQDEDVFHTSF